MRTTLPTIAGTVTLVIALGAPALAQAPTPYPGGAAGTQVRPPVGQGDAEQKASDADADFMKKAAADGQAEIELADIALKANQSPAVRTFASAIKADHMKAATDLKRVAGMKHVTLPSKMTEQASATAARLSKLTGREFDRAYADEMVTAHQSAVELFTVASQSADADVKAFANRTLPVLEQHLQKAQELKKSVGSSAQAGDRP